MTPRVDVPLPLTSAVQRLLAAGGRRLLGLAGPPGAGKSTLAAALHQRWPDQTVVVPMDGFHLAQAELVRLGRSGRKGAPDTFDVDGFIALLQRLKTPREGEVVYAPAFKREIEEPVAGAIAVPSTVPLVITEGNYLLLDHGPWTAVAPLLDECWFVDADAVQRRQWLIARHIAHGRSAAAAQEWVDRSDEANARLVAATRSRASGVVPVGRAPA